MKQKHMKAIKQTTSASSTNKPSHKYAYASLGIRAKAFLTDIFMLLMPLLYFVIYIIMGSLQEASHEKLLSWAYALIPYTAIISLFMIKDQGRSPGMRAQSLQVVDSISFKNASAFTIVFRNISFLLTLAIPFVWILPLFRKDSKTLHDLLSATAVVVTTDASKT